MPKVLIIADDLTGAADCAAACAAPGTRPVVVLAGRGERIEAGWEWRSTDVLAIDAYTRAMDPREAADCVARLLRECEGVDDGMLVFKKVDSTLRGHVGDELAAALRTRRALAGHGERVGVVLAPAFPAHGRTTRDGQQLAHGKRLDRGWDIAGVLGESGLTCGLIGLAVVRAGGEALTMAMTGIAHEVDVVICDAESDEDLEAIGGAAKALSEKTVWAGSAGLARFVARRPGGFAASTRERDYAQGAQGARLFVVGTPAPVSCEQAQVLADAPGMMTEMIPHSTLMAGESSFEWQKCARRIRACVSHGKDLLVVVDSRVRCASGQERMLSRGLARMIEPCADGVGALVVTGGETARAILDTWGVKRLRMLGEVEPGLPYSVTEGWRRNLVILTKAGGFGNAGTLVRCREFVDNMRRARVD